MDTDFTKYTGVRVSTFYEVECFEFIGLAFEYVHVHPKSFVALRSHN
jgi:hypothetical protein